MLAVLDAKTNPSAADVKKILSSVAIDADETCINKVMGELKGKKVEDVMASGSEKLSSTPSGVGGGGVPAASGATSAAPAASKVVVVEKKESESDEDMGFGLFD